MTQAEKARYFKSLHVPDAPVVLYNIWDAGSAKAIAEAGAVALATGSWSVAAAQGFGDGQAIPLDFALQIIRRIAETVDLSHALRELGYRQAVGVKAAVAIVLGRRLQKSRAISTSNWSLPTLSAKQLRYAADDAHASLVVYHALGLDAT